VRSVLLCAICTPISVLLFLHAICSWSVPSGRAVLVNVTVDDDAPDPTTGASVVYTPANRWSEGQTCKICSAKPPLNSTLMNSWHDSTYTFGGPTLNASFQFKGPALYVYTASWHRSNPMPGRIPTCPSSLTVKTQGLLSSNRRRASRTIPPLSFTATRPFPAGCTLSFCRTGLQVHLETTFECCLIT